MSLNQVIPQPNTPISIALDATAVTIVPLVVLKILPVVATLFTIVYLGMQMWTWIANKKWKRRNDE